MNSLTATLILTFIALISLSGCAATSQHTFLPDGSSGYRVDCSGEMNNMAGCLQKAGELCGSNGYQIIDQNSATTNNAAQNQIIIDAPRGGLMNYISSSRNQRYIMIKCKEPLTPNSDVR